jgi:hypothetical protein
MQIIEGADPNAVVDLLKKPYEQAQKPGKGPKGKAPNPDDAYNKAYTNLLAELVLRGANFEQLSRVGDAMRKTTRTDAGRRGLDPVQAVANAETAIADIIPPSEKHAFELANEVAEGVITKNNDMVKGVIGKNNKPGWLAEKPAAASAPELDDGGGTDGGPKPPEDAPTVPVVPPKVAVDPPLPSAGPTEDLTLTKPREVHDSAADANDADWPGPARTETAQEPDKQPDVDKGLQANQQQEERLADIKPERLAELVKLHETLETDGDDGLVSKLSQKVADSPIANPQLPKVLRQGKSEMLPDGTEAITFASKGQADKLLDKIYSKLTGATGASESESEPFAKADANGRYWPLVQLGMPDGRQIVVTPTFDSAGKVVGLTKLADGQMVEKAKAPSQAAITQAIEETGGPQSETPVEIDDTNPGGASREESRRAAPEQDDARQPAAEQDEAVTYDQAREGYNTALQELDADLKLGGSADGFAKVAKALGGDKPLNVGGSLSLVDALPTFGATEASEPRLPVLKAGSDPNSFFQQIEDHLHNGLPEGAELSYERMPIDLESGEVTIPVVQVQLPGESEPVRGVPVMNLSGQMIGLSTLGGLEKPELLKTLGAGEMDDALAKLRGKFGHR